MTESTLHGKLCFEIIGHDEFSYQYFSKNIFISLSVGKLFASRN